MEKEASTENYPDLVLGTALDVGENLLQCGGEVNRVEDTIERICRFYGAEEVEVFSITTLITGTIRMPDGKYSSQIRRVYGISNDLCRLEEYNGISREICGGGLSLQKAGERIAEAKAVRAYPERVSWAGGFLAAGACAVFFGGTLRDGISAAMVSLLINLLIRLTRGLVNRSAQTLVCSLFAGLSAQLLVLLGVGQNADKVMIGTIMLLIPGMALGNSLRELLCGDLISGTVRMIESLLLAFMVACGYALAIFVFRGVL